MASSVIGESTDFHALKKGAAVAETADNAADAGASLPSKPSFSSTPKAADAADAHDRPEVIQADEVTEKQMAVKTSASHDGISDETGMQGMPEACNEPEHDVNDGGFEYGVRNGVPVRCCENGDIESISEQSEMSFAHDVLVERGWPVDEEEESEEEEAAEESDDGYPREDPEEWSQVVATHNFVDPMTVVATHDFGPQWLTDAHNMMRRRREALRHTLLCRARRNRSGEIPTTRTSRSRSPRSMGLNEQCPECPRCGTSLVLTSGEHHSSGEHAANENGLDEQGLE